MELLCHLVANISHLSVLKRSICIEIFIESICSLSKWCFSNGYASPLGKVVAMTQWASLSLISLCSIAPSTEYSRSGYWKSEPMNALLALPAIRCVRWSAGSREVVGLLDLDDPQRS